MSDAMTQIAPASATLVVGTHPLLVAPSNDCLRADVSFIFHTLCIPTETDSLLRRRKWWWRCVRDNTTVIVFMLMDMGGVVRSIRLARLCFRVFSATGRKLSLKYFNHYFILMFVRTLGWRGWSSTYISETREAPKLLWRNYSACHIRTCLQLIKQLHMSGAPSIKSACYDHDFISLEIGSAIPSSWSRVS